MTATTAEIVKKLKRMSNQERLAVIEAATRLICKDLGAPSPSGPEDDPILSVAGCLSGKPMSAIEIEKELYGKEKH